VGYVGVEANTESARVSRLPEVQIVLVARYPCYCIPGSEYLYPPIGKKSTKEDFCGMRIGNKGHSGGGHSCSNT